MKEMSERRAHLLMQRGSETLRRSTGSLFACIVTHPMRNARSCAAVMAMGSWKQPDERCYIEQPWAPSLGTKMTPGDRTDRISRLSFRANFPNPKHSAEKRSTPSRQRHWNATGRSYSGARSRAPAVLCKTKVGLLGDTSHDHLSALARPDIARTLLPSAIYDPTCAQGVKEAAAGWLFY